MVPPASCPGISVLRGKQPAVWVPCALLREIQWQWVSHPAKMEPFWLLLLKFLGSFSVGGMLSGS